MDNRRTLEFFIMAMLLGIGGPVFALLGVQNGERMAAQLYPRTHSDAAAPIDFKSMAMGSPGDADKGHTLFLANCVACHGPMADGKGPAASSLTPPPRNFQDPNARWTRSREPKDIFATVSGGSPGTGMVGFANMLSIRDRWAIVHFLGTLDGVKGKFKPMDEASAAAWRPEGSR